MYVAEKRVACTSYVMIARYPNREQQALTIIPSLHCNKVLQFAWLNGI